jgi:hypothetical protein
LPGYTIHSLAILLFLSDISAQQPIYARHFIFVVDMQDLVSIVYSVVIWNLLIVKTITFVGLNTTRKTRYSKITKVIKTVPFTQLLEFKV